MSTTNTARITNVDELARSLDCMTEGELCALADVTPKTAKSWREHHKGPEYLLLGNRVLYPRRSVAEYLAGLVRVRNKVPASSVL